MKLKMKSLTKCARRVVGMCLTVCPMSERRDVFCGVRRVQALIRIRRLEVLDSV